MNKAYGMENVAAQTNEEQSWLEKGAEGVVGSFKVPFKKTLILQQVSDKQIELADKVASENEKFVRIEEGLRLSEIVENTAAYKLKLEHIQRDMKEMTARSKQMKVRAYKLQEAKQKEALKREYQRQKEIEKEELITARPAHPTSSSSSRQQI